jgi:ABC-2 type transport system permease protein
MLHGLWRLTWLEIKIFVREPLGVFGTIGIPVLMFVLLARTIGPEVRAGSPDIPRFLAADLPIFASLVVASSSVLSLVTIVAIYREGGILKRLRATPLRPNTILTAHVLVKVLSTVVTLALMVLAGRRYFPLDPYVPVLSFCAALLFCTACTVSLGFPIAAMIPTARFAQPIGSLIIYPMLGVSGLFVPIEAMPLALRLVARVLPYTYAVSLLRGIWHGEGWLRHWGDAVVLGFIFTTCMWLSARVFRWE